MAPKVNLVQSQLHYASGQFAKITELVADYKWFIIVGVILFLGLIYWMWRR